MLEIGGGIGSVQIELLRAGARSAISVELAPTYESVDADLLREAGVQCRVGLTVLDMERPAPAPA